MHSCCGILLFSSTSRAEADSIFVDGDPSVVAHAATGWQADITAPPQPNFSVDNKTTFTMLNATLRNGTFLQAGWTNHFPGKCSGNNAFFAYARTAAGVTYYPVKCQASNATQPFQWQLIYSDWSNNIFCFEPTVNGYTISDGFYPEGEICTNAHDSGGRLPALQAELQIGASSSDDLGPSTYTNWADRTDIYRRIPKAYYRTFDDSGVPARCLPYGGHTLGFDYATLGSNRSTTRSYWCRAEYETAWG